MYIYYEVLAQFGLYDLIDKEYNPTQLTLFYFLLIFCIDPKYFPSNINNAKNDNQIRERYCGFWVKSLVLNDGRFKILFYHYYIYVCVGICSLVFGVSIHLYLLDYFSSFECFLFSARYNFVDKQGKNDLSLSPLFLFRPKGLLRQHCAFYILQLY